MSMCTYCTYYLYLHICYLLKFVKYKAAFNCQGSSQEETNTNLENSRKNLRLILKFCRTFHLYRSDYRMNELQSVEENQKKRRNEASPTKSSYEMSSYNQDETEYDRSNRTGTYPTYTSNNPFNQRKSFKVNEKPPQAVNVKRSWDGESDLSTSFTTKGSITSFPDENSNDIEYELISYLNKKYRNQCRTGGYESEDKVLLIKVLKNHSTSILLKAWLESMNAADDPKSSKCECGRKDCKRIFELKDGVLCKNSHTMRKQICNNPSLLHPECLFGTCADCKALDLLNPQTINKKKIIDVKASSSNLYIMFLSTCLFNCVIMFLFYQL